MQVLKRENIDQKEVLYYCITLKIKCMLTGKK